MPAAGVAAIWNSGMMIRDPYSEAAKGEIAITMSPLLGPGIPEQGCSPSRVSSSSPR